MRPYNSDNVLVSVGLTTNLKDVEYLCFDHKDQAPTPNNKKALQEALNTTELLVGHNIKHDLSWILSCGFTYTGKVYDTMIAEFVMNRGIHSGLKLSLLAEKHRLTKKKVDLTEQYLKDGVGFHEMPWEVVEEYGIGDVLTTTELYLNQQERLSQGSNADLKPCIDMMCDFLVVLNSIESNGVKLDMTVLDKIKKEFVEEYLQLEKDLTDIAKDVMGDAPINLNSGDFMTQLLYSRKVKSKNVWKELFNIGKDSSGKEKRRNPMSKSMFSNLVRMNTDVVRKVTEDVCPTCTGVGSVPRYTKDGKLYKKLPKCPTCAGDKCVYTSTGKVAGLKLIPTSSKFACAGGFTSNYKHLDGLLDGASDTAKVFLKKSVRYSQLSTYITTFIEGMERYVNGDTGILHTNFNQTVAATARLSSSKPNFQNQPRAKTFPIRQVIVSRFEGGSIMDADYGQLEFRIAGYLSGCPKVLSDIKEGVDVHVFTRDTINDYDDNDNIDRQDAKSDTFKPLYGGMSGTARQKSYYKAFLEKYHGVAEWHERLKKEAITTKKITLPNGRQYSFPYAKRNKGGWVDGTTQIVNYPVQGFATADIVPMGLICLHERMIESKVKSVIVLTVHDSVVIDVYPGEEELMADIAQSSLLNIKDMCKRYYGIDFDYPLAVEVKVGPNLLSMNTIGEYEI
tara:strand:+ start:5425 stop:7455 length:2031 start_codon:yes stop_codon:yes gene_type:complete